MPKGALISVFVVAVLVNYAWELAQAPLYVGLEDYNLAVFWHCFVASLGDGVMVADPSGGLPHVAAIGLVLQPRNCGLSGDDNGGTYSGSDCRMGGRAYFESLAVYGHDAAAPCPRYWPRPHCTDAASAAVDTWARGVL